MKLSFEDSTLHKKANYLLRKSDFVDRKSSFLNTLHPPPATASPKHHTLRILEVGLNTIVNKGEEVPASAIFVGLPGEVVGYLHASDLYAERDGLERILW